VNPVVDYEIVAHLSERFPAVKDDHLAGSRPPGDAHVVYGLCPDIPLPGGAIPSGHQNLRAAQRFRVPRPAVDPTHRDRGPGSDQALGAT
jgi:hypothetical protein